MGLPLKTMFYESFKVAIYDLNSSKVSVDHVDIEDKLNIKSLSSLGKVTV